MLLELAYANSVASYFKTKCKQAPALFHKRRNAVINWRSYKVNVCCVPQVELMKQLVVGLDLADLSTHLNIVARTCLAECCCGI